MKGKLYKIESQWWVRYFSPPTVNPSTGYINADSHFKLIPVYPQSIGDPKFSTYWVEDREVEFEKVELNKPGSSYNILPHISYAKLILDKPSVDDEKVEKMYSEEEVYQILLKHQSDYRSAVRNTSPLDWSFNIQEWFQQIKK